MGSPEEPTPARRRGLPRSAEGAEQNAAADPGHKQPQQSSPPESDAASEKPTRRTGMAQQPPRRAGMGQQAQEQEQPARRAGLNEQPRRTGMTGQAGQHQEQPPRRSGLTEQNPSPAPSTPQPTPAEAKSGAGEYTAPKPVKTQPKQKTFLNRTAAQWGLIGGIGAAAVLITAAAAVLGARWLLGTDTGAAFVARYPGQYPQPDAPGGYPWWLNWAHFFNAFLMVLIIKTGIQIRTEARPAAYWSPKWNRKRRISLTIWLHNALDLLWVLNGAVFVLLLFVTGYWQRVVPSSWDVFPNALSAGLQYASLNWPTSGDWAHYNSLQELAYFTTIFVAAPLAILTGVRMSGLWPANNDQLNRIFPVEVARAVHFPVMVYFTVFILIHVILVLANDALRNLNQIYTGDDAQNWTGFWLFALSLLVIAAAAFLSRALFVAPIASLFGRVGR